MSLLPRPKMPSPWPVMAPGRRCDDEDGCPCPERPSPLWKVAEAVLGGLAAGAAPLLTQVILAKLFPEVFEEREKEKEEVDEVE